MTRLNHSLLADDGRRAPCDACIHRQRRQHMITTALHRASCHPLYNSDARLPHVHPDAPGFGSNPPAQQHSAAASQQSCEAGWCAHCITPPVIHAAALASSKDRPATDMSIRRRPYACRVCRGAACVLHDLFHKHSLYIVVGPAPCYDT